MKPWKPICVLSSSIIEDINGIETIKSLTSERSRYQKIDSEFVDYLKKSFAMSKAESLQKGLKHLAQLILNVLGLVDGSSFGHEARIEFGSADYLQYSPCLFHRASREFDQPPNQTSSRPSS